jgi:DNA gyrase subunit B
MVKKDTSKKQSYTAKDIYVLEGLEPVRKRPGMYIGSTGVEGLHHLIWEVVDNSLDEAMAGHARNIQIALLPENRVRVSDDGRGIPVEKHKQTGKSALETVMTTLHAGGKFGGDAYKVSGGLHGVGVSVVNALSNWVKAEICRDGVKYEQEYVRGEAKRSVKKVGTCRSSGTTITFEPDPSIFETIKFDWDIVINHLRQQAYLTKDVRIKIIDLRSSVAQEYEFYFQGGIVSYIEFLNRGHEPKNHNIFYTSKEQNDMLIEVAMQYIGELRSQEVSFANNIHTVEGGMHLTGFRSAITRTLNDYARKNGYIKEKDSNLSGDDVREGLTAIISVKIKSQELQFEGQTKAKLGNPEARTAVETVINTEFADWLERNPQDARQVLDKVMLASKARLAAKAARETVLRKGALDGMTLPGKLRDCSSKDASESELFILEGDSAGGSATQGRSRHTQAILPLRGKILNVEKARLDKMLASQEIRALIIALGTAIAEEFDLSKLRYHKVIIMTDADSVTPDTPLLVYDKKDDLLKRTKMGNFVENECNNTNDYQVFACNLNNKEFSLRNIKKTIRHPLRTKLYEITTRYGYKIKATAHHSVFTYKNNSFITTPTSELKIKDMLIAPQAMPRLDRDVVFNLSNHLKLSRDAEKIQVKVPIKTLINIPDQAWVDIAINEWGKIQQARQNLGISRLALGRNLGVYSTVLQQWEHKIDNVMPKYNLFKDYLKHLNIKTDFVLQNAHAFVPLTCWKWDDQSVEYYFKNHTHKIKTEIPLNKNLAYVLGWYMGDGCHAYQKNNPNRFIFALGRDKKVYLDDIQKALQNSLGTKSIVDRKKDGSSQLVFHSYEFTILLKKLGLLGNKSFDKFIPSEILSAKRHIQKAFLRGYLESDGCIIVKKYKNKDTVRLSFTTASSMLKDDVTVLLRQLSVFPSITTRLSRDHFRKDGVLISSKRPGYIISISGIAQIESLKEIWEFHKSAVKLNAYLNKAKRWKSPYEKKLVGDAVLLPITSIKEIKPDSPFVYDISVNVDENFVAGNGGFLLHNTDGSHIRTLLLTLFYRYFPQLIEKGYLYIAQPPLYRIKKGSKTIYAYNDKEKEKILDGLKKESVVKKTEKTEENEKVPGVSIQRYKGLGEMNPSELWSTTLDPEARTLLQVTINDAQEADKVFDVLMGSDVLPRRKFIQTHAKSVENLDI